MSATTTQRHLLWTPYMRPAPRAAEAALRVLSVGELDAATLALVIGADPGLTAAVVRASEPSADNVTIAARIAALSPARLHSALFPALVDALAANASAYTDADHAAWRIALATAIAAETIARDCGDADPDAAYLAGLLHNCAGSTPDGEAHSVRAIARRYRFPSWLVEVLDRQDPDDAEFDHVDNAGLHRVLSLARGLALDLIGDDPALYTALQNLARRLHFDPARVHAIRETAAQSLDRRLTLFDFAAAPPEELHAALLRFSNHLLLFWRVDESATTTLRNRVDHIGALRRFEQSSTSANSIDDTLLASADAMRASLGIDSGVIVAWDGPASPVQGLRWGNLTGVIEPIALDEAGPKQKSIQFFLAKNIWPAAASDAVAPSILPIHTPAQRHAGYIFAAANAPHVDDWLEHLREWTVALGRALDCVREARREEEYRETLRKAARKSQSSIPGESGQSASLLRQRNVARAAMAALNLPLGAITSHAHQLVSRDIDRVTQEQVEELAKQARNAARVMGDLRAIAGAGDPPNEFILINAPLRQYLHAARSRLERRSIKLTEHYPDGLPRIRADVRKLNHLLTNLFAFIEARLGFMGRGITVSSLPSDNRDAVCVRIDVNGLAIAQDQVEHLFDPFNKPDHAAHEFALSLAACSAIVEEAGGAIHAEVQGNTCTFSMRFEAAQAVLAVEPVDAPANRPLQHAQPPAVASPPDIISSPQGEDTARVLIVDDDDVMRDLMKQALLRREYRVETARDGNEALQAISAGGVDAVLLDLLMPNRDGFAVLRELKRMEPAPPVIVMTGSRAVDIREEAMALGANAYLQKPFELGQLLAEVESVLVHQHA